MEEVRRIGDEIGINWGVVPAAAFAEGLKCEMARRGEVSPSPEEAGRTAMKNLYADPCYYAARLRKSPPTVVMVAALMPPRVIFTIALMASLITALLLILVVHWKNRWGSRGSSRGPATDAKSVPTSQH